MKYGHCVGSGVGSQESAVEHGHHGGTSVFALPLHGVECAFISIELHVSIIIL